MLSVLYIDLATDPPTACSMQYVIEFRPGNQKHVLCVEMAQYDCMHSMLKWLNIFLHRSVSYNEVMTSVPEPGTSACSLSQLTG